MKRNPTECFSWSFWVWLSFCNTLKTSDEIGLLYDFLYCLSILRPQWRIQLCVLSNHCSLLYTRSACIWRKVSWVRVMGKIWNEYDYLRHTIFNLIFIRYVKKYYFFYKKAKQKTLKIIRESQKYVESLYWQMLFSIHSKNDFLSANWVSNWHWHFNAWSLAFFPSVSYVNDWSDI